MVTVDCRIGVVNKLDSRRRRRRPVLLTTRSTCCGEIFEVRSLEQSSAGKGSTVILGGTQISLQHSVGQAELSIRAKNQLNLSSSFDTIPARDGRTDDDSNYQASIASRSKNRWST